MLNRIRSSVVLLVLLGLIGLASTAHADTSVGSSSRLGVGFGGGLVTYGLTGKYHLTRARAVTLSLGGRYGQSAEVGYVERVTTLWNGRSRGQLDLAVGAAVTLWRFDSGAADTTTIFGGRGLVEFAYKFSRVPLEVTAEWGPSWLTGQGLFGGLYLAGGGSAVRWFF
jgi:hypothetical protein